jgi:hypothetical protein
MIINYLIKTNFINKLKSNNFFYSIIHSKLNKVLFEICLENINKEKNTSVKKENNI